MMSVLGCIESIFTIMLSGAGLYLMYKYEKKNKMSPKLKDFYFYDLEKLNELRLEDKNKFSDKVNEINLHIQIIYSENTIFVVEMKKLLDGLYNFTTDTNMSEFKKSKNIELQSTKIRNEIKKHFKI